jgi:molybdopterin-guanine dinucleotide biosynthesis protein A
MPFLNLALLGYMFKISDGFDMVIPRLGNLVEPLHTVYSRECLSAIDQLIKEDNYTTDQLPSLVKVRYVEAGEIDRFDPEHLSFFNINTQDDLEAARRLVKII